MGYVILENQSHMIAASENLSIEVGNFKSHTAKIIIEDLQTHHVASVLEALKYHKPRHRTDSQFQLWQGGSYPRIIESEAVARQKLEYIHKNYSSCVYVIDSAHWRYTSARNYEKMEGLASVTTEW